MHIQQINAYNTQIKNSKNNNYKSNSINFQANRYELALDIFEGRQMIKKMTGESETIAKELNEVKAKFQKQLDDLMAKIKTQKEVLSAKEKEYEKFNPSKYDFIDDVQEGKKQRNDAKKVSKWRNSVNHDGDSLYEMTHTENGTHVGDFPVYTP
jgi:hypothetical protein